MNGIVYREMESAALLALYSHACNEVTHVDHVAQLTDITTGLNALKQPLGLLVKHVKPVPSALQAKVGTHDAHIVAHDFPHFLYALGDKHLLLVGHGTLVIPLGHFLIEIVVIYMLQAMPCGGISIDYGLYQGIAGQAVAAMQTRARTLTYGIKPLNTRTSIEIYLDAATHIMGSGAHGDIVFGDIYADGQALGVDIGE